MPAKKKQLTLDSNEYFYMHNIEPTKKPFNYNGGQDYIIGGKDYIIGGNYPIGGRSKNTSAIKMAGFTTPKDYIEDPTPEPREDVIGGTTFFDDLEMRQPQGGSFIDDVSGFLGRTVIPTVAGIGLRMLAGGSVPQEQKLEILLGMIHRIENMMDLEPYSEKDHLEYRRYLSQASNQATSKAAPKKRQTRRKGGELADPVLLGRDPVSRTPPHLMQRMKANDLL